MTLSSVIPYLPSNSNVSFQTHSIDGLGYATAEHIYSTFLEQNTVLVVSVKFVWSTPPVRRSTSVLLNDIAHVNLTQDFNAHINHNVSQATRCDHFVVSPVLKRQSSHVNRVRPNLKFCQTNDARPVLGPHDPKSRTRNARDVESNFQRIVQRFSERKTSSAQQLQARNL